ncbi:hypothetical protein [Variovorax sp. KBW07]|uniref:hypothetical protein n=1 Tax=Variovorax sp. KBW07 TaxID=2153358 RepID=UPI000F56AE01|nr:hypothetical protein [Variovorax sp. KBW07]
MIAIGSHRIRTNTLGQLAVWSTRRREKGNLMKRVIFGLVLIGLVAGCAGPRDSAKQPVAPREIVWQKPTADDAIVYLLRSPHDKSVLVPSVDGSPTQTLPVDTYIALRLPPGTHRLAGAKSNTPDSKIDSLSIELKAGERRFFYVSTALSNPDHLGGSIGSAVGTQLGLVAGVVATVIIASQHKEPSGFGTHRWVECEDIDARGLASISVEVLAVDDARNRP